MLGGSDAGAHLDRMQGANYTTRFIADCLRGRELTSVEDAVRMMTQAWRGCSG
jgi:N-acyl-D-aspartate/D-glutamate deacylase